jgi:hypothetical protein
MKREYTKPDILFESFSLSTSIAGSCEVKTSLPTNGGCSLEYGPITIFVDNTTGCVRKFPDGIGPNGLCYYNPSENYNLFKS